MPPNTLQIGPPRELTDEEFLDRAESEIRYHGGLVILQIVAIGRKLVEVKERIGHGNYENFVENRLPFTSRTARNYVRAYELLKSESISDFNLDAGSLYLLARPSTPDAVRAEALEKARTETISEAEILKLIADARAKDEANKEARGADDAEKSAALAEQIQEHERGTAQKDQPVAKLESGVTAPAQSERPDCTAPHEKQITSPGKQRDDAKSEIANVGINQPLVPRAASEEAAAEAKEPPDLPVDTQLISRVTETREVIIHCAAAIKATPGEFIVGEIKVANDAEMNRAARRLKNWCQEYLKPLAKKNNGKRPLRPLEALSLFTSATVDQAHDAVTTNDTRSRPAGSGTTQSQTDDVESAESGGPAVVAAISPG